MSPEPTVPAGLGLAWTARPEGDDWARWSEGCYVLRTNIADWSASLAMPRPPSAFRRVSSPFARCGISGPTACRLGRSPRTILEELHRIQSKDVVLPTQDGCELRLRCVVGPDAAQAALLDRLGLDLPHRLRVPLPIAYVAPM